MSVKMNVPVVGNLLGLGGSLRPSLAIATFVLALLASKDALDSQQQVQSILLAALAFSLQTVNSLALQAAFVALAILLVIRTQQLVALPTHEKIQAWFLLGFSVAQLFA